MNTICQLYMPSFYRSYGRLSLQAVKELLPDLQRTGFKGIYLIGLFQSGGHDNGFDIVSYDVSEDFGTNEELQSLISEAHKLGLTIGVDVVPNHVSDQHELAKKCLDGVPGYEDCLYVVSKEEAKRLTENGVPSFFGQNAYSLVNGKYVRTTFVDGHQLNLNWNSPRVQEYFANLFARFKDMGIDFVRIDCGMMLLEDVSKADRNNPMACMNPKASVEALAKVAGDMLLFFEWFDPRTADLFDNLPNCYAIDCSFVMGGDLDFDNWSHPHMVPLLGGHDQMTAADRGIDVDEAIKEAVKHEYSFMDMQTLLHWKTPEDITLGDYDFDADPFNMNMRYRGRGPIAPIIAKFIVSECYVPRSNEMQRH